MTNVIITRSDEFRRENKTERKGMMDSRHNSYYQAYLHGKGIAMQCNALIEFKSLKSGLTPIKVSKRISRGQKFPS